MKDVSQRDKILFKDKKPEYLGGIERFENLKVEELEKLIELGFAELDQSHNSAPSIEEFLDSMKKYPGKLVAHGYADSPERSYCTVILEGINSCSELSASECLDLVLEYRYADELDCSLNSFYCWFD